MADASSQSPSVAEALPHERRVPPNEHPNHNAASIEAAQSGMTSGLSFPKRFSPHNSGDVPDSPWAGKVLLSFGNVHPHIPMDHV